MLTRLLPSRALVWIVMAVASVMTCAATDVAVAAEHPKQVLVLYSMARNARLAGVGGRELSRSLQGGLSEEVDYYTEYIDLARFPDQQYQAGFREFVRMKYRDHHFDLVIAVEEAALEFLNKYRDELFRDAPVVFLVVDPGTRRIRNSTGVLVDLGFRRTLALVTALQPDIEQVFVVSGASARERFYESLVRKQSDSPERRVRITYLSGLRVKDLEARVSALPPHSIVYYLAMSQDGAGVVQNPVKYLERLAPIANQPIYSWDDSLMGHGAVGGSLRHLETGVDALAQQALKVLKGRKADSIPTVVPEVNVAQVDWRQLQRWHIDERRVPAGTVVLFRELSVWTRYKGYILGALALLIAQSALIAGLVVQRARRRAAEELLRESQAELRRSYDRARDLGGRLLNTQEVQRARIARELQDDIGRQLAPLASNLRLLSSVGRDQRQNADELARAALDRVHRIARSVHDLSHRLHPAKLRLIGLVAALRSLQREFSQHDVEIAFVHDDVPAALPQDLALCLFRIVEEALQNAVTHSGARQVEVRLTGHDTELALTVVDNGRGFDVGAAQGKGLGLISMRERLEAIGGTLSIHSKAGAGTRLEILAPLVKAHAAEIVA